MEPVGADAVVPPRPAWRGRVRARRAALRRGVRLGRGVTVGRGVRLRAARGSRVLVGPGAAIGDRARLEARGGDLRVGRDAVLGAHCMLAGAVTVGRDCVVGDWARLEGDARLGDRARLAAHAVALRGAEIDAGTVVPSFVTVEEAR
jgi:carbonic anhydrase/acetyltransferase-like protein (isoleucine patch superfamily)